MTEKILIDTDLGSDCDDAGALAILHMFSKLGMAEICGITHCGSDINASVTLKAINAWYNRDDIPVGMYKKRSFLDEKRCKIFTEAISEKYLAENEMPMIEDAVKLMRRVLANNRNVTLITIGMFNNIADLLKSEPDEISDKTGYELVCESVKELYSMAGNFVDSEYSEYNIKAHTESAIYVAENFPKKIVYAGFELGEEVITSGNLSSVSDDCPIKEAYSIFGGKKESWDLIATYCAVKKKNDCFKEKTNMKISFCEDGRTMLCEGGSHS